MRLCRSVLVLLLVLSGCGGKLETLPEEESTSTAANATTAFEPKANAPITLDAGPGDNETETPFGTCRARESTGKLEVACFSLRDIELSVFAKGISEQKQPNRRGDFARVFVDLAPAVLAALADFQVPPVESGAGGRHAAHLGDNATAVLTLDPGVTFMVTDRRVAVPGRVPPFKLLLSTSMNTLPAIFDLARKGLLFPGETAGDPPPKNHSALYLRSVPTFSSVLGESFLRNMSVVGPAARVSDADWVAIQESSFEDAGKKCGGYKLQEGGEKGDTSELPLFVEKATVLLKERRSGKTLSEKVFEAPKTCPTGDKLAEGKKVRSHLPKVAVETWIFSELKAKH